MTYSKNNGQFLIEQQIAETQGEIFKYAHDMNYDMIDFIKKLNEPIEVNWGDWLMEHPDCDTICEDVEVGVRIRVFAYSKSVQGNKELKAYRNQNFSGKQILKGISSYAIAGII